MYLGGGVGVYKVFSVVGEDVEVGAGSGVGLGALVVILVVVLILKEVLAMSIDI